MSEQNNLVKWINELNDIQIPGWIKNNILLALAKGIGKTITAGLDIPIAYFESKSEAIRSKTRGKSFLTETAAKEAAKAFEGNELLAERALYYLGDHIIEAQGNRESVVRGFINEISNSNFSGQVRWS